MSAELMRKLTPTEHARIKGFPLGLVHGLSATTAHEGLGQGIAYAPSRRCFVSLREPSNAFVILGLAGWVSALPRTG